MPNESLTQVYKGRFAPSPTGPLHFGSLLAALASFLEAQVQQGQWLVRIENLDPPREDPKAASQILQILDAYQLHWHDTVRYQSERGDAYQHALAQLTASDQAYACGCSRKQLQQADNPLHLKRCQLQTSTNSDCAWRFASSQHQQDVLFNDQLQGQQCFQRAQIGDFVIRRRDALWSYQLAVVVDDADQGISHVVRGLDLLDSTPMQILLQQALKLPSLHYAHLPLALEHNGQKLSKQNLAKPLSADSPQQISNTLFLALSCLQHPPPAPLRGAPAQELLAWAVANWRMNALQGLKQVSTPQAFLRD